MTDRVAVTGSTGFVGQCLCEHLIRSGYQVTALTRGPSPALSQMGARVCDVGDLQLVTDWRPLIGDCVSIIHLAGRAHVLREHAERSRQAYVDANVETTKAVAAGAAANGVQQLIFMSTIKVFGDAQFSVPLRPETIPIPDDPYGDSKLEAENFLLAPQRSQVVEAVVVRPPLVYGPGVRANFRRLMSLVALGVPLPFAEATNARSFISAWNLADALRRLVERRGNSRGVWHVSDNRDCSTKELVTIMGEQMGKRVRLFAPPTSLLKSGMALLGKTREYDRLFGAMCIDISATTSQLNWQPGTSLSDGLARTVAWYVDFARGTKV